jgi:glycosyltransferase involved in cell wall biosynthesis
MLATGLASRGVGVSVAGPSSADMRFSFSRVPSVAFSAVEIAGRPRAGDVVSVLRLRKLLLRAAAGGPGGHVAHAHGMRAGALTVLARSLVPGSRRPGTVVTVHNAPPDGGASALVYRVLERVVARSADLVLCVSPDLERRMRAAGARRVERAVIAAPDAAPGPAAARVGSAPVAPAGRPVVLAVGRLARQKGFGVLLEAAARWRDLDPAPLVAIAGDGPLAGELRARAAGLGLDALFLGRRDDVPALLAAAAVFVLPSRWEGQPLVLQEALRAGAPVVAAQVGGVPCLTGEDAAVLVPCGDARALATAVRSVLTDAPLAARLRAAAVVRAATLPSEADAVSAALSACASVRRGLR